MKIWMRTTTLGVTGLISAAAVAGCCMGAFADGVQEGFAIGLECEPLIQAVNVANATVNAVPEAPADADQGTMDAEFSQLAVAYDQGAATLNAVQLSQVALVAERDELAAFYGEAAASMRAMPGLMSAAVATGNDSELQAHVAAVDGLEARENQIVDRINATCNRR